MSYFDPEPMRAPRHTKPVHYEKKLEQKPEIKTKNIKISEIESLGALGEYFKKHDTNGDQHLDSSEIGKFPKEFNQKSKISYQELVRAMHSQIGMTQKEVDYLFAKYDQNSIPQLVHTFLTAKNKEIQSFAIDQICKYATVKHIPELLKLFNTASSRPIEHLLLSMKEKSFPILVEYYFENSGAKDKWLKLGNFSDYEIKRMQDKVFWILIRAGDPNNREIIREVLNRHEQDPEDDTYAKRYKIALQFIASSIPNIQEEWIKPLIQSMGDPHMGGYYRSEFKNHIPLIGLRAVPALLQCVLDSDGQYEKNLGDATYTKHAAIRMLSKIHHPSATQALFKILDNESNLDFAITRNAIFALGEIPLNAGDAKVVQYLEQVFSGKLDKKWLEKYPHIPQADLADLHIASILAYSKLMDASATQVLEAQYQKEISTQSPNMEIVYFLSIELGKRHSLVAVSTLIDLMEHPNQGIQTEATSALFYMDNTNLDQALQKQLEAKEKNIKAQENIKWLLDERQKATQSPKAESLNK